MKVAVLGGFGMMAQAALRDLAAHRRVDQVLAADLSLADAKGVLSRLPRGAKVRAVRADLTKTTAAARALKGCDVVLNCAWYELNLKAMDLALALKAHYVDLGGLYHMTRRQLRRDAEFKRAGLLAALGCGSTPGITNMMAARMAASFETIDTVGIYNATHDPTVDDNVFSPPFSIRTMLAEFVQPAPVLAGGRMRNVPAHSGSEELSFKQPIGRVLAGTVIHSETATLPEFLRDKKVKNVHFKIAYPESTKRQLSLLVGMGLADQFKPPRPPAGPPRDFEILRLVMAGSRRGRWLSKSWDCEIRPAQGLSAGSLGVGFTASIASTMVAFRQTRVYAGAGAPESILDGDIFFRELRERKAFSLIETIARPLAI